jgi:hypothetical protein
MIAPEKLDAFCWSKMGTEAGQTLDDIIRRKEIERVANSGIFTWGIGNSLGDAVDLLAEKYGDPIAVFTPMKSKPKQIDVTPGEIFLWNAYFDKNGIIRHLPQYSFLTSRANVEKQRKKNHFALICYSDQPITQRCTGMLDSSKLVNFKSGKLVGASQVTAVVKNTKISKEGKTPCHYHIGFVANLHNEGHVKLARRMLIEQVVVNSLMIAAQKCDKEEWKNILTKLRTNSS